MLSASKFLSLPISYIFLKYTYLKQFFLRLVKLHGVRFFFEVLQINTRIRFPISVSIIRNDDYFSSRQEITCRIFEPSNRRFTVAYSLLISSKFTFIIDFKRYSQLCEIVYFLYNIIH